MAATVLLDQRGGGTRPAEVIETTLNGITFRAGRRTAAHLAWTDDEARRQGHHLRVIQPCYSTSVSASAGTHDYDAVVDVEVVGLDWRAGERFMRECGWACWFRFPPTFSTPHLHAVSLGCPGPVGIYVPGQVDDYYRHALGLKGQHDSGDDPTWHPADINSTVFDYQLWEDSMPLNADDKAWIQARLDAQRASIITDLLKAAVNKAGDTVKKALRVAAGLGD